MKTLVVILLNILLPTLALAQDYDKYLETAKRHIESGNYDDAKRSYNVYKAMTGNANAAIESALSKGAKQTTTKEVKSTVKTTAKPTVETTVKPATPSAERSQPTTASAQYTLGTNYFYGKNSFAKDQDKAALWYRRAAEQGYAMAQCSLGYCYHMGYGVTQNLSEAVKWYRKAAEQGYAAAQCNLGICYEYGQGVAKNHIEAAKWYRKAIEQGDTRAKENLARLKL
ncbi:MAG: tetratricopeptide repeat protein [Rikenellaceae bacterium]